MSEENKATEQIAEHFSGPSEARLKPIVLKLKKGGKRAKKKDEGVEVERKEKYTRGLEDIQRLEGNVVRVAHKASKALTKSMNVYEHERQQSARAKTDGAIEDFIHNTAKAGSAYLKEAADLPLDLAEAVSPGAYRKRLRRNLRRASKFIRLWRI